MTTKFDLHSWFLRCRAYIPFRFALALSFFIFLSETQTEARIFRVTDTTDGTNTTHLRGAIIAANADGGDNTIILAPGSYRLTIYGPREDAGFAGDLDVVRGNLTIVGPRSSHATISAAGLGDRIFRILPRASLKLKNLILTSGFAPASRRLWLSGENGGAVYNAGTVNLDHCVVTGNASGSGSHGFGSYSSRAGDGGGIFNQGILVMNDCLVAGNSCSDDAEGAPGANGGGIANAGSMSLNRCVIRNNSAGAANHTEGPFGFDGGNGGGVFNSGDAVLIYCNIADNSTGIATAGGQWGILNASLSYPGFGGGTGGNGGGFFNLGRGQLFFCTIHGNSCKNGGAGGPGAGFYGPGGDGGPGGSGGGVYNANSIVISGCIITGNSCGSGGAGGYGAGGGKGGTGGSGGGIYTTGNGSPVLISGNHLSANLEGVAGPDGTSFIYPYPSFLGPR